MLRNYINSVILAKAQSEFVLYIFVVISFVSMDYDFYARK